MKLHNLVKLTNRYLNFTSIYKDCDFDLLELSDDVARIYQKIPIVIFIKDSTYIDSDTLSFSEVFNNIFIQISIDIDHILNIEHLILLTNMFKENPKLGDLELFVLFVNLRSQNIDYQRFDKIDTVLFLKLFTKKRKATINMKLLENIIDLDKSILARNIQNTLIDYLFPRQRRKSIEKVDPIINPWNNLYLQNNSKYMSVEDAKKNAKKITIIHCPICAAEKSVDDQVVAIKNSELAFLCNHKNTQFARYESYKIDIDKFEENFEGVDTYTLSRFFKHNIQPVNRNNVYFVKHIFWDKIQYIPLKEYMKIPRTREIKYEGKPILKIYYCPICAKKHHIVFDDNQTDSYIDVNNIEYVHYSKLFKIENPRIVFMCDHKDSVYEMYKYFSIRNISKHSFIDNALKMVNHYMGNYQDGKKIIYGIIDKEPYIIDLANYL